MICSWFPPNIMLRIKTRKFNPGFIRSGNLFSWWGCSAWTPCYEAQVDGVVQLWLTFWNFQHTGFLELSQSDQWVLNHVSYQESYPQIAIFSESSEKTSNSSKLIPFQNDRGPCALRNLQCSRNDFDLCLDTILPLSSGFSSFHFIWPTGVCHSKSCTLQCRFRNSMLVKWSLPELWFKCHNNGSYYR